LASFGCAIAIKPDYTQVHSSIARALYTLGRYDEAIAACNRAIALEPGNAELHSTRGYMLRKAGLPFGDAGEL
jgi:Flp pilus assembly protein TadD